MTETVPEKSNRNLIVFGVIVGVLVVGGFVGKATGADFSEPTDWTGQVKEVCHDQVSDQLKAPSTADFGGDSVTGTDPDYYDSGYVDAENSFGAKIRTNYSCEAHRVSDGHYRVKAALE